ncbi:hypothetical protein BG940_002576 [Escherichia coli]|nr:hypothetical protein [Escherichia coli]
MTVSTEVDHNEYTGNGVTTTFPYTFRIFQKSDLVVQVVDLNENITELILDTDYIVTGAGGYNGGNIILSMLSFLCGLLFYKPAASILIGIASLIPTITQDSFEKGIVFSAGAFVSAIVAVRIGIWLYHRSDNPRELIPGRKDDGNA